jgi:hypothetical protein
MSTGFIYIWRDNVRNMYYIGSHIGSPDDGYVSSSNWLTHEIKFRPNDFKRRIIKFLAEEDLKLEEYRFIKMIKESEYGKKYYNLKCGAPKGNVPANKGKPMSIEQRKKLSNAKKGKTAWNKGIPNPNAAENARKGAAKLSAKTTGRKMITNPDGSRTWSYS